MMYGTLAGWRSYALARGNEAPNDADDDVALAALVRAGDYIEYRYVANFRAEYDYTLPVVSYASYEAATVELGTPGMLSQVVTTGQTAKRSKAGPVEVEFFDRGSSAETMAPTLTIIEAMMAPYMRSAAGIALMVV